MAKFKAKITVQKNPNVADPEGKTISEALARLGHKQVMTVRSGKVFFLEVESVDQPSAVAYLEEISRDILSNPVIEVFEVEIARDV